MSKEQTPHKFMADTAQTPDSQARELELRRYQLAILSQATQDMVAQREPAALLESFLLTAMGAVGAVMGFNLALPLWSRGESAAQMAANPNDQQETPDKHCAVDVQLAARGLDELQRSRLTQELNALTKVLPPPPEATHPAQAQLVIRDAPAAKTAFPKETALVLGWKAASGRSGFFGLGPRLNEAAYDAETTAFLQNLLQVFIQALENVCANQTISLLNKELQNKNNALQQALRQARDSQDRLDRRVFQLRTLYDAATELSPLQDVSAICNTFVLLLQGAMGVDSCCLLLHDAASEGEVRMAARGLPSDATDVTSRQAKELLLACLQASSFRELTPLSVTNINLETLQHMPMPLPSPSRALLLRVDENLLGLLLLGERLADSFQYDSEDEEDEALRSLCHNTMLFLRNARSFATIQELNRNLQQRNQELERTLEELTASRSHIEVLERAGARLRGMLQQHASRVGRASVWDFVCILAASLVLGLFFNMTNPNGVRLLPASVTAEPTQRIAPLQAQELLAQNPEAVLVDARPTVFYEQEHAAGSLNLPPSLFDFIYSMRFASSSEDPMFIVYGRTVSRLYDEEIAQRLISRGHGQVMILQGGLEAWQEVGGEYEEGG